MKVEVQWKKLVKPSVPTPNNRQKWKLSSIDELQSPQYAGIIFYYRYNVENPGVDIPKRLHRLEESLSQTLSIFYPMAGRYYEEEDGCFVHCNDLGVELVHAKVGGQIDQVLCGDPNMELLKCLSRFPTNVVGNPLIVIQVNTFECGGLAIGMRSTHKIVDMYTMAMFINSWATTCRGNINAIVHPNFELSSLFPVKESVVPIWTPPRVGKEEFIMSRFRFSSNALSKLKALARDNAKDSMANDFQRSRLEVVSALIGTALVDINQNINSEQRVFVVCMTVNLRKTTNLAIPANSYGNFYALMFARFGPPTAGRSKFDFNGMVNIIRHMISEAKTKYATVGDGEEFCSMVGNSLAEFARALSTDEECLLGFTSWCRFGLYENDFGWGRPVLVSNTPVNFRSIVLIDDEESGGIDAWITVSEDEMILLKQDPEILAFTSYLELELLDEYINCTVFECSNNVDRENKNDGLGSLVFVPFVWLV